MAEKFMKKWLLLLFAYLPLSAQEQRPPFVTATIMGQLGNNLFQVAVASALAWDNGAKPCFPEFEFESNRLVYNHVFFRCNKIRPKQQIEFEYNEPIFSHMPIPFHPNMKITGYFQSEKYFVHHRDRLLELFAPRLDDLSYIQEKYSEILDHPNTVGVQLRYYKWEFPNEDLFPQYGIEYLEKAMALFPESSLFVVSSNNLEFARKNIPSWVKNVIFIENEPHYIDFYLLSFCKHNIITNSSFGWWGAWLNQNPNKIIVRPAAWIKGLPTQDVCPEEWITIEAIHH